MRTRFSASLLLASLARAAPINDGLPNAEEATKFAFTYGFPLVPYAKVAVDILGELKAPNIFYHSKELATPEDKSVVRPNADTLYSSAPIDLSCQDLVVHIPAIEDRYWVFPFYDVYGNNYANLGSNSGSTSGKYLVRYAPSVGQEPGVQLCDAGSYKCDGFNGIVNAPTTYGLLLPRLAVKNRDTDIENINTLQEQMDLRPLRRKCHGDAPPLTVDLLNSTLSGDEAMQVLELTARVAPYNPPPNIKDQLHVDCMLKTAGIHDGVYEPRVKNLTAVAGAAQGSIKASYQMPANSMQLQNGWETITPDVQGNFGGNYEMRSYVAVWGYLQLQASEALYPTYAPEGKEGKKLNLGPDEAYVFTFLSKPPVATRGFWSLTAYGPDKYLIDNPMDRYLLGDRDALTYADGTLVYGVKNHDDESFQILIQPSDKAPPQNWTSNWLPAPAGGGDFELTLRFYAPGEELQDGTWVYPAVQKLGAITESI
ncbi:hypothetical protein FQN54_009274 [Arachnomyces sp. PD_36]|nr:hypothetical protein FQN54_009274 [Arachnomyces sp. PD_36]